MNDQATKLCRAIDNLVLSHPRKTPVVEPEVRELLRVAHLRREAGRMVAAIGTSRQEASWQQLEAALRVR